MIEREHDHEQDRPCGRAVGAQPPPQLVPGTAPSRENANVIREALVMQAIPQNSCPTVEIRMTALAAATLSAVSMIAERRVPRLSIDRGVGRREGEREQHDVADDRRVEHRPPDALRRPTRGFVGLLGDVRRRVIAGDRVHRQQEAERQHVVPVHALPQARCCCAGAEHEGRGSGGGSGTTISITTITATPTMFHHTETLLKSDTRWLREDVDQPVR